MARSLTGLVNGVGVAGVERVEALLEAIPPAVLERLQAAQNKSADDLVSKLKAVAPVSELDPHPGALRDSVHKTAGPHALSVSVVVDAADLQGNFYAKHVEHGHRFAAGGHAAPEPFFYPTIRVSRSKIRAASSRAVREGMRRAAAAAGG